MDELKNLVKSLEREIELLKELVKAKDDLIQQMRFAPAPIIIRESQPILQPYIAPITTPVLPWQPPYVITCDGLSIQSGQIATNGTEKCPDTGIATNLLAFVKAK